MSNEDHFSTDELKFSEIVLEEFSAFPFHIRETVLGGLV